MSEFYTIEEMDAIASKCLRSFEGEAGPSREDEKVKYHRTVRFLTEQIRVNESRQIEIMESLAEVNAIMERSKS